MWFESIVQLELQGSALELGKAISQKLDKEMAFSLLLSLMMAFYNHYTVCGRFWAKMRACMDARVDDDREECRELQQEGQDLLPNSASRLRHSGRGVRLVLAARSDENVYGFLCLRLWLEHEDKSGRRLHLETPEWHMPIWALGWDAASRGRCGVQTHLPPKNGSSTVAPVENWNISTAKCLLVACLDTA